MIRVFLSVRMCVEMEQCDERRNVMMETQQMEMVVIVAVTLKILQAHI